MHLLVKARKKVEDAINDVQNSAVNLVAGRVHPGMYQQPQLGYHGQYPTQAPPQNQWQQPQYQYRGYGQAQQYQQYQPYRSPVLSPPPHSGYAPASQQYYAPTHLSPGQNYTPSPVASPVLETPHQPQYFSPEQVGQPQQRYTPSPPAQQQHFYAPSPSQPHDPPPAYTSDLNEMLGVARPSPPPLASPPPLPARKPSTARSSAAPYPSDASLMDMPYLKATQSIKLSSNPLSYLRHSRSTSSVSAVSMQSTTPPSSILYPNQESSQLQQEPTNPTIPLHSKPQFYPVLSTVSYSNQEPWEMEQQPVSPIQTTSQSHPAQSTDQQFSHLNIPHLTVFELPTHEAFNHEALELPATEARRFSNPPIPNSAMPKPLALPIRHHKSVSGPSAMPKPLALPSRQHKSVSGPSAAPKVGLSCLATEGGRTAATKFYVPKTGEYFSACDNCYQTYIVPHQDLVECFETYTGSERRSVCNLSFGRVQQIVLTQCVPHRTLDPIREFVRLASTLPPCNGANISSPGPVWFTRMIPDLAICTTCFELHIRLTSFANHFETKIYPESQNWSCGIAVPYLKRQLRKAMADSPTSFPNFAEEANYYFKRPLCTVP